LTVRVEHDDDVCAFLERVQVARLLVRAVSDVVWVPDHFDRQLARNLNGVVA